LAEEVEELGRRAEQAEQAATAALKHAVAAEDAFAEVAPLLRRRVASPVVLARLLAVAAGLRDALEAAVARVPAAEEPLRALGEPGGTRSAELGESLHALGAGEVELHAAAHAAAEAIHQALLAAAAAAARVESPLRARVDAGSTRTSELAGELRRLGGEEVEARRAAAEAGERAAGIEVEIARLEADAAEAGRRFEAAASEPAE